MAFKLAQMKWSSSSLGDHGKGSLLLLFDKRGSGVSGMLTSVSGIQVMTADRPYEL